MNNKTTVRSYRLSMTGRGWYGLLVHEPDQMSVPLLVANAIIPFWKALGVRNEKKCDSQFDSVAFRFY